MSQIEDAALLGGGELGRQMRAYDWAASPIGPVVAWPVELRTVVGVMLGSKQPMFTVWGPSHTLLFNDAYRAILGSKEPGALGGDFLEIWREIRTDLQPLVDRAYAGEPIHMDDITLMVDREGRDPEAHFAFSYTPIRNQRGTVCGFLCACSETTEGVMARQRQEFRLRLEAALAGSDMAEAIVATAGRMLGEHLRASRVGYGEINDDGQAVFVQSAYEQGVQRLRGRYLIDVFGKAAGEQLRLGQTVAVPDVLAEAETDPAMWASIETRAYVSAPILRAGRLAGSLFVNHSTPRHWSRQEVALIRIVASRVNEAVQRARAEAETRQSHARFHTLTQSIPIQVWTAGIDGVVDWFNQKGAAYFGTGDPSFGGAGWMSIVHEEDRALAAERWEAARSGAGAYEAEFRLREHTGTYRWHLVRGVPELDAAGVITRWIGTSTDINDKKNAELELLAAKAAAEEANLAKSTFIANMSHELRTPLSAIIGYSEMMAEEIEDGCAPDDLAGDLAKVEGNARHLLGLINDVLDLSKIESGKMEAFAEDFPVEPMLREVVETVGSLVAKKGNQLALEIGAELGDAHTDVVKLRQMLLNLLSNAAKFTENGTVTLAAAREGAQLRFTVRDTGIGMTDEQLERLFQRFTQADTSTTRRFGGTGLGLSLTRAFAEMLGGTVSVQSAPGAGSAFSLLLPARFEPIDDKVPDELPQDAPAPPNLVLVIDDDADQRTLMTRFLHREGFAVQVAGDGRTGLALARQLKPRAVLLDVLMPGVDGWSVLTALKSDPALGDTPVVMVTSVDQRSLAASLGAADYMLKPVQWDRFRSVMDRFRTPQGGILLVEDDAGSRQMIRAVLEEDGWTVTEAGDGREGLEQAALRRPDVVLTDLNMPVVDGFDFLEHFRRVPGCADVPVVVLTARDLSRDDRRRLRGASQILNKGDISVRGLVERLYKLAEKAGA